MKRARVFLCALLIALSSFSAYGTLPQLFAAAASGVSVTLGGGFSRPYFEAEGEERQEVTPALGMEARFDWAQNQIVSYNEKLSGNYSVSFSLVTTEADWWDLSLYFGADSPNVFTSKTRLFFGHSAGGLYARGVCAAAGLYETDGVTEIADGVNLARDLGGNTAGKKVYYRFEKIDDARIEVYYGLSPEPQEKRCVLLFSSPIPDGYFCMAPIKRTEIEPFYLYLDDLAITAESGETLLDADFSNGVPPALTVDGAGMEVTVPAVIDGGKDVAFRSAFDYAAADGEYFNVRFSYRRFGTADAAFCFGGNRLTLGETGVTLTLPDGREDAVSVENGWAEVALTVRRDTLTLAVNGAARTYGGVSAAGRIAFTREKAGSGGVAVAELTLAGNAEDRVLSVEINEYLLRNAAVGGTAKLAATVNWIFGTSGGPAPAFTVVEGSGLVTLTGSDITFDAPGEVTLRAEAEGVSDTAVFSISHRSFATYALDDDFTELNPGNFTARDPNAVISFNSSVVFTNDRADRQSGYEGAKLVSNVKFVSGNGPLFDLSFSPYVTNAYKGAADPEEVQKGIDYIRLNKQMSFGVLLGMKSQSVGLSDAVYLRLNPPNVELFANGVKQTPVGGGSTDAASYMDHDDPNYLRLVARADGALEVYLGNASHNIDELFAVYEGLDLEGYVAFTTNSYNVERVELPLAFKSISLTGNVERDMENFDVLSVRLDKTKLNNAVVSKNPILLQSKVVARPNLTDYHGVKYSVTGSGARIEGDKLYIDTPEKFTLRATSRYNQSVYDVCEVTPKVLEITDIAISADALQNLTVYSQPVLLTAVVTSNYSYIRELNEVEFTVLSGNAELFTYYSVTSDSYLTQLRVTGPGEVVLRATSKILDGAYDEVRFTVTDPDAEAEAAGCGCGANPAAGSAAAGGAALAAVALIAKRKLGR